MTMPYDLALELKNAGFPLRTMGKPDQIIHGATQFQLGDGWYFAPTLDQLIEACEPLIKDFFHLAGRGNMWSACDGVDGFGMYGGDGKTAGWRDDGVAG